VASCPFQSATFRNALVPSLNGFHARRPSGRGVAVREDGLFAFASDVSEDERGGRTRAHARRTVLINRPWSVPSKSKPKTQPPKTARCRVANELNHFGKRWRTFTRNPALDEFLAKFKPISTRCRHRLGDRLAAFKCPPSRPSFLPAGLSRRSMLRMPRFGSFNAVES